MILVSFYLNMVPFWTFVPYLFWWWVTSSFKRFWPIFAGQHLDDNHLRFPDKGRVWRYHLVKQDQQRGLVCGVVVGFLGWKYFGKNPIHRLVFGDEVRMFRLFLKPFAKVQLVNSDDEHWDGQIRFVVRRSAIFVRGKFVTSLSLDPFADDKWGCLRFFLLCFMVIYAISSTNLWTH